VLTKLINILDLTFVPVCVAKFTQDSVYQNLLLFTSVTCNRCLQCFDAVGWEGKGIQPVKKQEKQSGGVLLPFWYRLTQVVLEKRPLNGSSTCNRLVA